MVTFYPYRSYGCLTFDVSVYNHVAVQVTHPFQDLSRVFTCDIFCQCAVRLELVFNGSLRRYKYINITSRGRIFTKMKLQVVQKKLIYPRHVFHEDRQSSFMCVPQAAVVLNYAFMKKILQELDLTLQSTHLLNTSKKTNT